MPNLISGAEEIYSAEPMKDTLWKYSASLPKSSFSGCDISVIGYIDGKIKKFGELLTMSYSVHREKMQVRTMGRVNAKGFTRGTRTIAGSLIFVSMDRTALWDWLGHNDYDPPDTVGELPMIDQLPPMDVSISFSNEYGTLSTIRIYGIELVDHGMTMSVDDMITEQVISYMAIGMQEMAPEGLEYGPAGKTWSTTGLFINGYPVEAEMNRTHGILKKISELNTEIMDLNMQIAKLEGLAGDQVAISLLRRKLISSSAELDRWQEMAKDTEVVGATTKNAELDQFGRYRDDLLGGLKPYVLP